MHSWNPPLSNPHIQSESSEGRVYTEVEFLRILIAMVRQRIRAGVGRVEANESTMYQKAEYLRLQLEELTDPDAFVSLRDHLKHRLQAEQLLRE